MSRVALITGSTRTPRAGNHVVTWVHDILKTRPSDNLSIEPLHIADFNLPVYDEPVMPALVPAVKQFVHEHSKRWSAAIQSFAGYIFVIPEYSAYDPNTRWIASADGAILLLLFTFERCVQNGALQLKHSRIQI